MSQRELNLSISESNEFQGEEKDEDQDSVLETIVEQQVDISKKLAKQSQRVMNTYIDSLDGSISDKEKKR